MRKPRKKTITERVTALERLIKSQQKKIKELEQEIKRLDLEEITEIHDKLNKDAVI